MIYEKVPGSEPPVLDGRVIGLEEIERGSRSWNVEKLGVNVGVTYIVECMF